MPNIRTLIGKNSHCLDSVCIVCIVYISSSLYLYLVPLWNETLQAFSFTPLPPPPHPTKALPVTNGWDILTTDSWWLLWYLAIQVVPTKKKNKKKSQIFTQYPPALYKKHHKEGGEEGKLMIFV